MKISKLFVYASLVFVSCNIKQNNPALVRVVNAMPDSAAVNFTIRVNGKSIQSSPSYMQSQGYESVPSGKAEITVSSNGKTLLQKDMGLGNGRHYTLLAEGMPRLSTSVNQQTSHDKLLNVFSGAEASDNNGFLPVMKILQDNVSAHQGKAKVRVVNAAAARQPVEVTLQNNDNKKSVASSLAYPSAGDMVEIEAGTYHLSCKFKGMPSPILNDTIQLEPCYFYTVVIGDQSSEITRPLRTTVLDVKCDECR